MKTFYTLFFILLSGSLVAQIQGKGGLPTTTKLVIDQKAIPQWLFQQPDIAALQAEDALPTTKAQHLGVLDTTTILI